MNQCKKCRRYYLNEINKSNCNCKKYVIKDPDDCISVIYASSEDDAVLKFATDYNELDSEFSLMETFIVILVTNPDGKITTYEIGAVTDIRYTARET